MKKENFGLKLRIYHLEEALKRQNGEINEDWEMVCGKQKHRGKKCVACHIFYYLQNIELHVKVDQLKQDIEQRDNLVRDAK